MIKKFEDFLFTDKPTAFNKLFKFAEYRKGSSEYGQLFQDLMMILRLKREEDKDTDSIILNKKDFKNIDFDKFNKLLADEKSMRKLGMSFDVEVLDNSDVRFYNLGNKESRPWENNDMNIDIR